MDDIANLADLRVGRIRRVRTQLRGSQAARWPGERFERQKTDIKRPSETKVHKSEILRHVDFDREPDSAEFAGGLEDCRRHSLLPNSVASVVTQLDSRGRVRPYFGQQCELSRSPVDLCNKEEGAKNCENGGG